MHDGWKRRSRRPSFLERGADGSVPRSDLSPTLPGTEEGPPYGDEADATRTYSDPPMPVCDLGTLTMISGADAGSVYRLGATTIVGRAPTCEIQIDHPGVSRRHARIVQEAETQYVVQDLGSRNGTTVRGRRVTRHRLVDGDRISFGPILFRFALADESEELALRQRYEFSVVDGLTGALNRKHFDDRLIGELAYAKRHQTDVSLLMLDIDHFKSINDRFGHQAGDLVLRQLAATIQAALRTEDVFARYGGEEFVIIARGIGRSEALLLAERVRKLVATAELVHGTTPISITVSVGIASLAECTQPSVDELIGLADAGLYLAKAAGRNCCRTG